MSEKKYPGIISQKTKSFAPATAPDRNLAVSKELANMVTEEDYEGYEEARHILPIVSIRQKAVEDEKGTIIQQPGGFRYYDPVAEVPDVPGDPGLTITVIGDQKSRIFWEEHNMDRPVCRSRDGLTGIGNPGGECALCPLSQWGRNGDRPKCAQEINLLCYDHALESFYVVNLKRSGLKPYDHLKILLRRAKPPIPLHFTRVRLATERRTDPAPHWVPRFIVDETLDLTMVKMMKEFRKQMLDKLRRTVEVAEIHDEEVQATEAEPAATSEATTEDDELPF